MDCSPTRGQTSTVSSGPCLADADRLDRMTDLSLRCPRCKQNFSDTDADRLADSLIAHLEQEHGHAPPREHVLSRIERRNSDA